jgi:RimJ/RimL family protein N-acetyltransferase
VVQIFETERLVLREWEAHERDALGEILSDPVTMSHWPAPLDDAAIGGWFDRARSGMREHGCARWCCERRTDGRIVGDMGIVVADVDGQVVHDLGYIVHHPYWRQGYALEAMTGAVAWARAQGIDALVANMATDNGPSVALAEKLGMRRDRTFVNSRNRDKPTFFYRLDLRPG